MPLRSPTSLLTREQLDSMHSTALRILETTGILVEHAEAREVISRRPGFRLEAGRVRIAPECVERVRKPSLATIDLPGDEVPLRFHVDDRQAWIAEPDGRTLRAMTTDDVVRGTKLVNALYGRGVRSGAPGYPQDVPSAFQPLEQYLIAAEWSRGGGGTSQVTDLWTAKVVRDLDSVYGRPFWGSAWCPSPLILGGPEFDILWHYREEAKGFSVGTMPIVGVSGPCDLIGAYTLSIAECLGGLAILSELLPGVPGGIHPHPEPADMRSGAMTTGSPEWDLLDLMTRDVFAYYGQVCDTKLLLTAASVPDAQAAAEKSVSATSGLLAGYRAFGNLGQLACDEVFSPEQLLIDIELVENAERATRLPEQVLDAESLVEAVDEVVREGSMFAEHESTALGLRRVYGKPGHFVRAPRGQWLAAGSRTLLAEVHAEVEQLIDGLEWEPPQDVLRELRTIVDAARADLT